MCYYLIAAAAPPASGAISSLPSASAKHGTGAPFPYSDTNVPDRDIFSPDYCTYAYILLTLYLMRALSEDTQVRTPAFRRYDTMQCRLPIRKDTPPTCSWAASRRTMSLHPYRTATPPKRADRIRHTKNSAYETQSPARGRAADNTNTARTDRRGISLSCRRRGSGGGNIGHIRH